MAIYYIDVDDEITSAAARIRDASEDRVALVIQGGSRVATSRINFRLLAREARHHGRHLSIVAADPSVRSMVQTAGLPVFASVADYQKSESAAGAAGPGADAVGDALGELAATVDTGADGRKLRLAGSGSTRAAGAAKPVVRPARRFGTANARWLAVGLVAAVVFGCLGAFMLLPSATVVLTLKEEPVGPADFAITVDPAITVADDATLSVPGVSKEFGAQASGTFTATGQNVVETAATGTVTFTSANTGSAVAIPAGTQVTTASGLVFATTAAVTVPKATLSGLTVNPARADAPVAAVKKGLAGNVAVGAIVNVPAWLAKALVYPDQVTNKKPTTGGTHTVTPFVQQSDLDAAEASLAQQVDASVRAMMTDPGSVAAGFELFPKTAQMNAPSFDPDPATLLNQSLATFDLAATGSGTATAANLATVRGLADRKIRARVQGGHELVDGSVSISFGSPTAAGASISVPVVANALQAATVDEDQLRAAIKGKSAAEAKTYLSQFGDAEVSLAPFWVSTITGFDFRIDFQVVAPTSAPTAPPAPTARVTLVPVRTATPTGTPGPTPTAVATDTPTPLPSPTPSPSPSPTPTPEATASIEASPTATP
jgi:hypothetical protein